MKFTETMKIFDEAVNRKVTECDKELLRAFSEEIEELYEDT